MSDKLIWLSDAIAAVQSSPFPIQALAALPAVSPGVKPEVAALAADAWQPIETAPKDELIDIWLKEGKRWCDCYYDAICDEWRTSRPSGKLLSIKAAHVSHWMPRPAKPSIAAMIGVE